MHVVGLAGVRVSGAGFLIPMEIVMIEEMVK